MASHQLADHCGFDWVLSAVNATDRSDVGTLLYIVERGGTYVSYCGLHLVNKANSVHHTLR